jgi:hypothetical protein
MPTTSMVINLGEAGSSTHTLVANYHKGWRLSHHHYPPSKATRTINLYISFPISSTSAKSAVLVAVIMVYCEFHSNEPVLKRLRNDD